MGRDRRAVVSVVGTLLSLLVFFALFGIFLTQVAPVWMSENEEALTVQLESSLGNLKADIDTQVTEGGPSVLSVPFQLNSATIPLLAQPTSAYFSFIPGAIGIFSNVTMQPAPGATGHSIFTENISLGVFTLVVPNRYYAPQTFSMENDAVIQSQGTGQQVIEFPPTFSLNSTPSGIDLTASIVDLTGTSTQSTGLGTQEVFSHFVTTQSIESTSANHELNATFTEGTSYPCAWTQFLSSTLNASGVSVTHTITPSSCPTSVPSPVPVKITFRGLTQFTLIYSEIRVVIGVGTE